MNCTGPALGRLVPSAFVAGLNFTVVAGALIFASGYPALRLTAPGAMYLIGSASLFLPLVLVAVTMTFKK